MRAAVSRALMAMAAACMGEGRRGWATAMRAEFEMAEQAGDGLRFAIGCLAAAWRGMLTREEGHFILTSYALVLGLMIPMAAVQIGCALLGLPYLYPGTMGVPVAMLKGGAHEALLRSVYLNGLPSFTFLLLVLGAGHLRLAWAMLDRDWSRVLRAAAAMLAAALTLVLVMSAFFLDSSRALLQGGLLAVELATVAVVARWHGQLFPPPPVEQPG
ncbi:hypothetical protein OF829_15035 [Sphingomonas sp. LB-2]|uniref:hypothetical protein n=1 Tax=Sphingomonas caeni TaxID=2984949 RepID=UPI0022327FD9|nr:hypothetical protein [Sphingomonas caeni]MCW3848548.1 hypothetical protein [Sphingomonas caeni]